MKCVVQFLHKCDNKKFNFLVC